LPKKVEMEEWREIEGYPGYMISNHGRVWSCKLKRVLESPISKDGYYRIGLWRNQVCKKFFVHRLVANAFIPNPDNKPVINHLDGNKLNNLYTNLDWDTVAGNNRHSREVLGNVCPKGVHVKMVTLVKDDIEYHLTTSEAMSFLKCSGVSWNRLRQGLKPSINGYKIKNLTSA